MTDKIAAIITNYNMPERTDALVKYIKRHVKNTLVDVVVVDNGSDLVKPSKYTIVKLKNNIQTTGGWLAGLDVLQDDYLAYWFMITSTEFTAESYDPLTPMVAKLKDDSNAVGVHNALTKDSTTAWKHLITRGGIGCRPTWMIDNISSLYRADWFDEISRFDPDLIYGWGIDLETSWLARTQGRSLWVCEDAKVKKVTDIGYAMSRMNMSAEQRRSLAGLNMLDVFRKKYGIMGYQSIIKDHIEDYMK